ncbi:MAG: ABC transporter ATP-binding protein [Acidobacteria bacterium RIFCSPLOWO2_12_FULL_59_11]|nr:MAG: ABC transporter ATP-binding protein [Acidobacteria bacterium RIFCSPLOWO2_12_FULL_59_11]
MSVVIRVQDLSKCYQIYDRPQDRLKQSLWRGRKRFFREFWALKDISFEVNKGETVGIIGRNGSGKSTLLQLIVGTLNPTEGDVTADGRVAALLELGSGFNPDFTGRENVYMNGAILGLSRADIDARFEAIAAFADIGDFIDQPVKTYSSGMLVRLAFSVSINVDPDILIVDEALAVGDMGFQLKCLERLNRLTKSGITMLLVSHDIGTIKAFCSRAIYLVDGRMKACGSASDMVELYLLDMRDAQKRAFSSGSPVKMKTPLGSEKAFAFGTDQGHVLNAVFADTESPESVFSTGDTVNVRVEVEYAATVKNPAVSLVIHDHRMIDLSGRFFSLTPQTSDSDINRRTVLFSFPAELNNGHFFLTVRLEDRLTDENFFPIDKQVGALSFSVIRPTKQHFIGLVHLPIQAEEL